MIAYLTQASNPENINLPSECPWTSWVYREGEPVPSGTKIITKEEYNSLYELYRLQIEKEEEQIRLYNSNYKIEHNLIPITYSFTCDSKNLITVNNPRTHNTRYKTNKSTLIINITNNGESDGIPLFYDLENCGIQLTTRSIYVNNDESPWCYVEGIVANTITIRIKKANTGYMLIGGFYQGNIDNNLEVNVYLQITGASA